MAETYNVKRKRATKKIMEKMVFIPGVIEGSSILGLGIDNRNIKLATNNFGESKEIASDINFHLMYRDYVLVKLSDGSEVEGFMFCDDDESMYIMIDEMFINRDKILYIKILNRDKDFSKTFLERMILDERDEIDEENSKIKVKKTKNTTSTGYA